MIVTRSIVVSIAFLALKFVLKKPALSVDSQLRSKVSRVALEVATATTRIEQSDENI